MLAQPVQGLSQQLVQWLRQQYGDAIRAVMIYGSQARGTAGPDSDVDVLIVVADTQDPAMVRQALGDFIVDKLLEQGLLVSILVVRESVYRQTRSPFFENVRREAVVVLG